MRVLRALFFPFMICALQTNAQTELDGKGILSGNDAALRTMEFYNRLMMDSAKYVIDAMKANLLPTPMESSELSYLNTYKDKAMHDIGLAGQHAPMGVKSFNLWSGGHLSINGTTNRMLGLMVFQTGSLSLHQDFGRFQLSASATANKYWMPMQSTLYTQYGFGFGSNIGVRRYINPMSGQWTTSPIVTPYFRVGKRNKVVIGLPLGELLKAAVWGDRDNPMRFRPQPQPQPQQHPKKK